VTRKAPTPAAERQKRYRRHTAGDHSICLPSRCEFAGQSSPTPPAAAKQSERGPRGAQLWQDMADAGLGPLHRVLLEEACRIADRLDRLDAIIEGRADWLRQDFGKEQEVQVSVDNILAESRQQATALRGLIAELRAALPKSSTTTAAKPATGGLSDFSAALAARRRSTAG
jgi:hypothetical protein